MKKHNFLVSLINIFFLYSRIISWAGDTQLNVTKLMGSYNLVNPFWTKFHLWRNRSHDKMKLPRRCCIFSKILGYGSVTLLKIRHLQGCSSCIFPVKYNSMVACIENIGSTWIYIYLVSVCFDHTILLPLPW